MAGENDFDAGFEKRVEEKGVWKKGWDVLRFDEKKNIRQREPMKKLMQEGIDLVVQG